jgi:hypothetical protein
MTICSQDTTAAQGNPMPTPPVTFIVEIREVDPFRAEVLVADVEVATVEVGRVLDLASAAMLGDFPVTAQTTPGGDLVWLRVFSPAITAEGRS